MLKKYICAVLMASILLTLCSCNSAQPELDKADEKNQIEYIERQEAVFEDANAQNEKTSYFSLGNAALTLDKNRKVVVEYKPFGGAVSIELKDESGNTWRLDIPENALPYGETITMQLTENIEADMLSGKPQTGIILQPEGLQFTKPAMLTVTGVEEQTCLFFGTSEGKELNFFQSTVEKNALVAEIWHFSSYIEYTPTSDMQIEELAGLAKDSYSKTLEEVKDLLKTPISLPPIPPNYTFMCEDKDGANASSTRNRALDMYIARVLLPEKDIIKKLLGASQEVSTLGGETGGFYYAGLLQMRNLKKVDKLIRTYKNDVDKLVPVMNVTLNVIREAEILGLDVPTQSYLNTLSDWMVRAAEEQLRKIREEHDYKAMGAAVALIQGSQIISSDFKLSSEYSKKFLEKLKDALTFTVTYDVSLFSGISNQKMTLSGEAKLSWLDENNQNSYTGTGEGKYLIYTHSGPWNTTIDFPNTYPVTVKFLDFSPCNSETVDVQVDTIGAKTEVWYNPAIDERSSAEYGFVNFIADELFKEYKSESGGYVFKLPFKNGSAIMGSEGFTKTETINYPEEGNANGSITYVIEIKHTPR